MEILDNILPFLSPIAMIGLTYWKMSKVKLNYLFFIGILLLFFIAMLLPHLVFVISVVLFFYSYSRYQKNDRSRSLFYALYVNFWIILLSVAFELSILFLFEDFAEIYVNSIHYASFPFAFLVNSGISSLFKIDYSLLRSEDNAIVDKIIKPMNKAIFTAFSFLIIWAFIVEFISTSIIYGYVGILYFSLLTSLYFIFMGLLSTKIKEYLSVILEHEKDQRYQELKKYTEDVEEMQNELADFKHDMKNIWISFNEVIRTKDNDFIEQTYSEIKEKLGVQFEETNKVSHELVNLKETVTKGLLHQKQTLAKELELDLRIDIKSKIVYIDMEILEFIRIIGILLDNAIEEAQLSERREVFVGFVSMEDHMIIEVANSTDQKQIPVSKIFKKGYTTKEEKGENRGRGLSIVSNILKEIPQVRLRTIHRNGYFNQTLTIWNNNEN